MEKTALLPIHNPIIMDVMNVMSVYADPTAANASAPTKCPTTIVSAIL